MYKKYSEIVFTFCSFYRICEIEKFLKPNAMGLSENNKENFGASLFQESRSAKINIFDRITVVKLATSQKLAQSPKTFLFCDLRDFQNLFEKITQNN